VKLGICQRDALKTGCFALGYPLAGQPVKISALTTEYLSAFHEFDGGVAGTAR
jgi:hypothetical protein